MNCLFKIIEVPAHIKCKIKGIVMICKTTLKMPLVNNFILRNSTHTYIYTYM